MTKSTRIVEAHYDVFPYPTVSSLAQPLPSSFKRDYLSFLLRRRRDAWLPPDAKIWVAGCGTQQGIHWALSFPEADVLATDVSESTLALTAGLASQLALTNVRFEKQDLMHPRFQEQFDFIVCTGVLHHLPDPAQGLAHLRAALRPGGAALLMVYSTMHREPLAVFRRVLDGLTHAGEDVQSRYDLACRLLDTLLTAELCSPPCPEALELLRQRCRYDRSFVADALLHPLEVTYDIDGLLGLLRGGGFAPVSWLHPSRWNLAEYLDDPDLLDRFSALDPVAQWNTVYHLAGYSSPLLECLVEPVEAPQRPPYSMDELLAMSMVCSQGSNRHTVQDGRVIGTTPAPAYEKEGDELVGRGSGGFDVRWSWRIPAYVQPLFDACDGSRPLGALLQVFSDEFDQQDLLNLFSEFLPTNLGLLTPRWEIQ